MHIRTPVDMGAAIRHGRRRLGLDQAELAEKIGVSRQWVGEIERGKPRAEIGLVLRALNILGIAVHIADEPESSAKKLPGGVDLDAIIAAARRPRS